MTAVAAPRPRLAARPALEQLGGGVAAVDGAGRLPRRQPDQRDDADVGHAQAVAIDPSNPSVVYASSAASARKTTDGGATWSEVHPNPAKLSGARALAIDPSHPSTVYAVLMADGRHSSSATMQGTRLRVPLPRVPRTSVFEYSPIDFGGFTPIAGTEASVAATALPT